MKLTTLGAAQRRRESQMVNLDAEYISHTSDDPNDLGGSFACSYPEGGPRAWIVVAGASMTLASTFGLMSTVGILQTYLEGHYLKEYSSATVGWIPSAFVFLNLMLGVQVGPLFDRYGPRLMLVTGSALYVLSMFLLSFCTKYYQFMLCLGVLSGVSSAFITTPSLASISHWFYHRRGIGTGVAMAGSSVGGIAFPLFLKFALAKLGWAWAVRSLTSIMSFLLAVGNICIKERLPRTGTRSVFDIQCFTDSRFIWVTIGAFFAEVVLFASLGLIPSYAASQGFDSQTGFYSLVVFNIGSGLGRWISGMGSDYYGRFNTISVVMSMTVVFIFVLWLPFGNKIAAFYPFVAILGFGTGTILSLPPVCLGQICKMGHFGQWFGTCYFVSSFGTLVGIPIGAQLLQVTGPSRLVAFLGGLLGFAALSFATARWACLEYHWRWFIKI